MADPAISLGPLAQRRMKRLGLTRADLEAARWGPRSESEGREFLRCYGVLPDGRSVVLDCMYGRVEHIVKFLIP